MIVPFLRVLSTYCPSAVDKEERRMRNPIIAGARFDCLVEETEGTDDEGIRV
jgi:hypothetical protein